MQGENIEKKFINATKWSVITEIIAKLISPVTNMILARIIAPEAFGVVTTVIMITSFAVMFTDAGFQKYLVQHEFKDEEEKFKYTNVAFWTNFGIAIFLWLIIIIFCEPIAIMVGNPGLGKVIAISSVELLLTSFSSIQMALYRRDFEFKTLFLVRIVSVCIPFIITIPLAFLGLSYWALIIGTICGQLSNAIIMTIKSKWKPQLFYKVEILKKMLSFSIWSLIEAVSIWFTTWIDVFIIGNSLNKYYLGIYKTSTTLVNSLMALITSAIIPVFFSALSRLQNDNEKFNNMFLNTQRKVSIFVFPLGVGLYMYSDLATKIMLGSQWSEASGVIAIWALTSSIIIVLSNFNSEVYRAKGRPKLSFLSQILHLAILVPVCIISSKYGFWVLVNARSWIRLEGVLIGFILMKYAIRFPIMKIFRNIIPTAISSIIMGITAYLLRQIKNGLLWSFISIMICCLVYFLVLYLFPSMREDITKVIKILKTKIKKKIYMDDNQEINNSR